jgi:hypothetical protein
MNIELFPFSRAPAGVKGTFECSPWAEGCWEWFRTLAETTLAPDETAIVAALRDTAGGTHAALPLVREANGSLHGLASPYTTRFSPQFGDDVTANLFGRSLRGVVANTIRLDALDGGDPAVRAFMRGLSGSRIVAGEYRHFSNWYEPISDFELYWQARPSQLREIVRRKLPRLEQNGRLSFQCLADATSVELAIEIYEKIYAVSWQTPEPHSMFISQLLRSLMPENIVRVGIMSIDAEPIAVQICLVKNARATIFKLAHKTDSAKYSPGTLLTFLMLRQLIPQDCLSEIDFGRGDDAYKRDWMGSVRSRIGLIGANWRNLRGLSSLTKDVLPTRAASLRQRFSVKERLR